jgi:hypothetical protein
MTQKNEALRLSEELDGEFVQGRISNHTGRKAAVELRRLHHNNQVLKNALWKACGDDEGVVNDTIASEGELK